jgi:hypothetical protein
MRERFLRMGRLVSKTMLKEPVIRLCLALLMLAASASARAASLTGSFTNLIAGTNINLTIAGPMDWAHWGFDPATNLFNRSTATLARLSDIVLLTANPPVVMTNSAVGFVWTNGTPTTTAITSNALAFTNIGDGFEFTAAADTTTKRLQVFIFATNAQAAVEATLSDSSAPAYTDFSLWTTNLSNIVYTFTYAAASSQQTLRVRVWMTNAWDTNASVGLGAAALVRVGSNQPPSASLLSPTNDANIPVGGDVVLNSTANDADGVVTRVEFFDGALKLGETTNAPFSIVWTNPMQGIHTLTARARDDQGTNTTSPVVTVFVVGTGGALSSIMNIPTGAVNLTLEGAADWVHWGLFNEFSLNRKVGVTALISNFTFVGTGPAYRFADNFNGYTWTDGTPTAGRTNTPTGVYVFGLNNGFEIQAPADTSLRTLRVHVGVYGGRGKLRAFLSDFNAPAYSDTAVFNSLNGPGGIYAISYRAASAGQKIIVRYTLFSRAQTDGNVTLQAASVVTENNPPAVSLLTPAAGAAFLTGSNIFLSATAMDADGGVNRVEFLDNDTIVAVSSNSPYQAFWTNASVGFHVVRARGVDNLGETALSGPSLISVIVGGGLLRASMATNPPLNANLSTDGVIDWGHWGLATKNSFNHRAGVTQQINDVAIIGSGTTARYANNLTGFAWTNGTPTGSTSASRTGIFVDGLSNGFQLTVSADTQPKRLRVFAGLYGARSRMEATLSDFSAAPFINNSLARVIQNGYAIYTFDFAAPGPGRTLTLRYTSDTLYDTTYGNVTWQAATLSPLRPTLSLQGGTNGSVNGNFLSAPNTLYVVEFADAVPSASWQPLTNISGTGTNAVFQDSTTAPNRFYRLRSE